MRRSKFAEFQTMAIPQEAEAGLTIAVLRRKDGRLVGWSSSASAKQD